MGYFLLKRIPQGLLVIFGVTLAIFLIIRVIPGDPVRMMMSGAAPDAAYDEMVTELGLDQPLMVQFGDFFGKAVRGDLGRSLLRSSSGMMGTTGGASVKGESMAKVSDLIKERVPLTFALMATALLFAIGISFFLGIISGMHPGSLIDGVVVQISVLLSSIPNFWLGIMLIQLVTIRWVLLPSVGYRGPAYLLLPGITLGISMVPVLLRTIRESFQAVIKEDYIKAAIIRGVPRSKLIYKHVLKNALIPVITLLGLQLGYLLGWTVVIEWIFSFPGLGLLTIYAVLQRDFPVIQGIVVFLALFFVVINILVDALYAIIDPRIQM